MNNKHKRKVEKLIVGKIPNRKNLNITTKKRLSILKLMKNIIRTLITEVVKDKMKTGKMKETRMMKMMVMEDKELVARHNEEDTIY